MKYLPVRSDYKLGVVIREYIKRHKRVKNIILKIYTKYWLRYKLSSQLLPKRKSIDVGSYDGLKVFIPLVETSHYQHHHILGLGRVLSDRGADVLVLVCEFV